MSREMVKREGMVMLGRPAVSNSCNSLSLTMLIGRLFSVIHLTRWALYSMDEQSMYISSYLK
jgi:hypothetical protein